MNQRIETPADTSLTLSRTTSRLDSWQSVAPSSFAMTRRSFTIKRANRYAELLRARYLARDLIKVRLFVRPELVDEAEKHEALEAYDQAFQRGVDEELREELAEESWNSERSEG